MQIFLKILILIAFLTSLNGCEWAKKKKSSLDPSKPTQKNIKPDITNLDSNIWISNFERLSDSAIYIDTTWYFYDDSPAKGKSKLRYYNFHQSLNKEAQNHYLSIEFTLKKSHNENYPYTGFGVNLEKSKIPFSEKNITGIIYDYKGYSHYLVIKQDNVLDFANYQSFLSASNVWKRDTVLFAQMNQPNWGKKTPFDFSKTTGIDWFFTGSDQENGSLQIDNIRYLVP
jgi:hypothetical protein